MRWTVRGLDEVGPPSSGGELHAGLHRPSSLIGPQTKAVEIPEAGARRLPAGRADQ
jgi:hypothetical protein